jgi:putative MATE family efflux protein
MVRNQEMMEHGSYRKLLLNLCVPTVVIMLVMVIYNMADTFFIGQTGDPNRMAAVSLCTPLFTIFSGIGTLFGNGGCTTISISLGEQKTDKIKEITGFCVLGALCTGIIAAVVLLLWTDPIAFALGAEEKTIAYAKTYLRIIAAGAPVIIFSSTFCNIIRADGSAVKSMIANTLGTVTNILLDALFILVFDMGVSGAALATVIGNLLTGIYLVRYVTKSSLFTLRIRFYLHDPKIGLRVLYYGLPMACSTLIMSISSILSNHLMISYGTVALAAQGVAGKFGMLISMLAMGVCMGLQPAISYAYGNQNRARIMEIVKKTAVFTFILGLCLAVLGMTFRSVLVRAFIDNEEVIRYGSVMVLGSFLVGPFVGWYQLCQTFLQSTGKADYATFVALLDKGLFYIPILLVMAKAFGVYGIAFASPVTTAFSLMAGLFFSFRWYGSWKKNENDPG